MTQEADSSDLIFNGIDGASGTPYYPSLTADEVATLALGRPPDAQAVAQVGRSGSAEQVKEAVAVLDEARRKIFTILAQD